MPESMTITEIVALWGAGLSTVLAVLRIWELWKNRVSVEVSHNFTSDPDIGNEVIIRNLTGTPVLVKYWELVWARRRWPKLQQSARMTPDERFADLQIPPHDSIKLPFRHGEHFDWGPRAQAGNSIYLRLHVAGKKRPIMKLVYSAQGQP